jgi:uridine phosphorylase
VTAAQPGKPGPPPPWLFETSEPFVTPEQVLAHQLQLRGSSLDEVRLPPTLVATFQRAAYERLLERAGVAAGGPTGGQAGSGTVGDLVVAAVDGVPVAVARITVGAPAAALLLENAIARGVHQVLVAGSAGSLQRHLPIGSTVVVEGAEREDGTSHHYLPAGEVVAADPDLTALLETCAAARGAAPVRGRSWTIDAPYRETVGGIRRHREAGVAVVEMEAAALFAIARVRAVRAGLIVAVSDELFDVWTPGFGHPTYLAALSRAADACLDAAATLS